MPTSSEEAIFQELMREDFLHFLRLAFSVLNPGKRLKINWHHEALALEIERIRAGEEKRLLVNLPPRSLKSITFSVAFVAWALGQNSALKFMCVSYGESLAAKLARDCRKLMQHPRYLAAFPETRLGRVLQNDFETTKGGGRLSESLGGGLTGRGADIVIVDDPIKAEDARSEVMRDNVEALFRETLSSRTDSKIDGIFIVVMQRLHEEDLTGRLLEGGGWRHVCFPAIASQDRSIPRLRQPDFLWREGAPLDEEREPLHILDDLRRTMRDVAFSAQYLQAPLPDTGQLVKRDWLSFYRGPIERRGTDKIIDSWDCANSDDEKSNYSVCVSLLIRDGLAYVIGVLRVRLVFPDLFKLVIDTAQEHRADVILIEDAANGRPLLQQLRQHAPPGLPAVLGIKPEGEKRDRLGRASVRIQAGQMLLPEQAPWLAEFVRELLGFPLTKYDDQVDALSQALLYVMDTMSGVTPWPIQAMRISPWLGSWESDEVYVLGEDPDEVEDIDEDKSNDGFGYKGEYSSS